MSNTQRRVVGWTLVVFTTFISTSAVMGKGYFSMKMPRNYQLSGKYDQGEDFMSSGFPSQECDDSLCPLPLVESDSPKG